MFKELTKEEILKKFPDISERGLKASLEIEEYRKTAYKQGYRDGIRAMTTEKIKNIFLSAKRRIKPS